MIPESYTKSEIRAAAMDIKEALEMSFERIIKVGVEFPGKANPSSDPVVEALKRLVCTVQGDCAAWLEADPLDHTRIAQLNKKVLSAMREISTVEADRKARDVPFSDQVAHVRNWLTHISLNLMVLTDQVHDEQL